MFIVAEEEKRNALAPQFLCRLPLTEDHAEWRVVLNAIEILINHGNTQVDYYTATLVFLLFR